MAEKLTYEELEQRVKELEKTVLKCNPAKEALIESEKLYRLIVENVTDIIWIVDMGMKVTYFSPSVTQMRGYSVKEAMAQSVEEAMTPASFESAMKMIAEELELHNKRERDPKRSRKMEAELTCKDGSTVWTEIESNFIYNSEGQPTGILGITRNITERKESEKERKRAEEALRESNEKLTALFQSSPMAIITLDPDGNVTFWNPAAEKMFGWREKEVIGRFLPYVPEEKKSEHHALRNRVLSGEGFHDVEALRQKKDGSDIYISISTVPLKDSTGCISGIMSVSVDITERKQAEAALKASEEKYRLLVQNITSIVYKGYKDWSVEFFDKKIELTVGYTTDDFNLKRMKWNDIIVKEDIEIAREIFIKALKTDKSYVREYRIKSKAGDIQWIQERANIVCDNKGEIDFVSGVFFNITDRKRIEEEREKLIHELQNALAKIKTLSGLLPICSHCKKIRDDKGYWNQIESYIHKHSGTEFSHGICPECAKKYYPDFNLYDES